MKIPKELEEKINQLAQNDIPLISKKLEGMFRLCMKIIALRILQNPTRYGLVEIEKVSGLVDTLEYYKNPHSKSDIKIDYEYEARKALADWEKIKGGES